MIKEFNVGIKSVITQDGKVLLLKKTDREGAAFWDIPGGRMDDSETITQTLDRELQEEIPSIKNYTVGNLLNAYRLDRDLNTGQGLFLVFYKVISQNLIVSISEEHEGYEWFDINDLENLDESERYISSGYLVAAKKALE